MEMARLAVECNVWPLYEFEDGEYTLNYEPKKPIDMVEYLKPQGRFRHIFKEGNEYIIDHLREWVNKEWNKIRVKCGKEPVPVS